MVWAPPWTPPAYSVETSLPFEDTQSGLAGRPGRYDAPQAFTRLGSVCWAHPGTSETRLVWM